MFFGPLSYVMGNLYIYIVEISSSYKIKASTFQEPVICILQKVKWTKNWITENQEKQQNPVKVHEQITHKQNSSNRIFYENSCECLPFLCSVPKSIITQYPSLNNKKKQPKPNYIEWSERIVNDGNINKTRQQQLK